MTRLAVLALASALMVATIVCATHRRYWAEMSCEDYAALLEGDEGVTWA